MQVIDPGDAEFTRAERYCLSRRTSTLHSKLALYRDLESLTEIERLLRASFGAHGSYIAKQDALAAWDALSEEERARLLSRGRQRSAATWMPHGTQRSMKDRLREGPTLIDPFGLKRQERERAARENFEEVAAREVVATMLRVFGRDRRDRSHLRLVK